MSAKKLSALLGNAASRLSDSVIEIIRSMYSDSNDKMRSSVLTAVKEYVEKAPVQAYHSLGGKIDDFDLVRGLNAVVNDYYEHGKFAKAVALSGLVYNIAHVSPTKSANSLNEFGFHENPEKVLRYSAGTLPLNSSDESRFENWAGLQTDTLDERDAKIAHSTDDIFRAYEEHA